MNKNYNIEIVGITDVGRTRDHNEDFIAWDEELGLLVLADGMGGHNAGEVASQMAVEGVIEQMKDLLSTMQLETTQLNTTQLNPTQLEIAQNESLVEEIVCCSMESISAANRKIFEAAAVHPEYSGMGTTLVMVFLHDNNAIIAHVGDSRLYRLRDEKLEQLTVDHSVFQEMVQSGYMSEGEAERSLNKNMITRALGINLDVDIDVQQQMLEVGDILLLCSDGLSDLVSVDDMQKILLQSGSGLNEKSEQLVLKANENGGRDNISAIIASIDQVFEKNEVCS